MKLPATLTSAMVDHLNRTYFSKVWNSPDEHEGANFQLTKAYKRLAVGTVPLDRSVVALPTTDRVYATYRLPRHHFTNHTYFRPNVWVTDQSLLTNYALSITTYAENGRKLPVGSVYLRYDPFKSEILVAVEQAYTSKCIGKSYPDLWATVYLDSTRNTPVVSQYFTVGSPGQSFSTVGTALAEAKLHPAQSQVWMNGYCYTPSDAPGIVAGDVVEIVTDPDITSYCDIKVDNNTTGYQSVKYDGYREILHIPKALNPHGYVITTDTLLMVIVDPLTKKGVLGHRLHPHALEPITHHDFSVGRDWLNRFAETMGVGVISVRLYLRFSNTPHRLGNDVNHMADLYTLPDDEIKKQLIGTASQPINRWRAEYLEQSPWLKLAYSPQPFGQDDVLAQFASAMGYYDVASVLSQLVHYHTYTGSSLKIQKPARLSGYPCEVAVWSDGLKLPDDYIETIVDNGGSFEIGFHPHPFLKVGSELVLYILTGGERYASLWSPTASQPSIILPSSDYDLVQIYSYLSDQPVWKDVTRQGYKFIPLSPGDYTITDNGNGSSTFRVNATHYGQNFYLVPLAPSFSHSWNLDLTEHDAVVIPLEITRHDGTVIPLIGRATLEFYLNGYRLSEGLDYTLQDVLGPNGDRLQYLFVLSNQSYLDLDSNNNLLEMLCHTDKLVSQDTGYVISHSAYRDEPPCIWSPSCGRLFAGGKIISKVTPEGNNLVVGEEVSDGSPFLAEWTLPYGAEKLLAKINPSDEKADLFRISSAVGEFPPVYPDTVILDKLHALFSPALAQIVHDVAEGSFVLKDEPSDQRFLNQLKPYRILLESDPILLHNPLIDRRFVTLAAHYVNLGVSDPTQMHLMQRVIGLLLDPSALSIREVLL